jgi:hypothetical protein
VGVANNGIDERPTQRIDCERPRHSERFARGNICVDLVLGDIGECHFRVRDNADSRVVCAASIVDEPVSRIEDTRASALTQPPLARDRRLVGFSVNDSVDDEDRIATKDQPIDARAVRISNGFGLGAGQQFDHLGGFTVSGRCDDSVLVNTGCHDQRFDPGSAQSSEPGG